VEPVKRAALLLTLLLLAPAAQAGREFDGSTQRAEASAAVVSPPFSASAQFFSTTSASHQNLWSVSSAGSPYGYWRMLLVDNLTIQVYGAGDANDGVLSLGNWSVDTWHVGAIAAGASGQRKTVWVDGAGKGTVDTAPVTVATLTRTTVGALNSNGYSFYLTGVVGPVSVWSIELGDDDVASLAIGAWPPYVAPASLVAFWLFESNADPEPDGVGGVGLALTGAPAKAGVPNLAPRPGME